MSQSFFDLRRRHQDFDVEGQVERVLCAVDLFIVELEGSACATVLDDHVAKVDGVVENRKRGVFVLDGDPGDLAWEPKPFKLGSRPSLASCAWSFCRSMGFSVKLIAVIFMPKLKYS